MTTLAPALIESTLQPNITLVLVTAILYWGKVVLVP